MSETTVMFSKRSDGGECLYSICKFSGRGKPTTVKALLKYVKRLPVTMPMEPVMLGIDMYCGTIPHLATSSLDATSSSWLYNGSLTSAVTVHNVGQLIEYLQALDPNMALAVDDVDADVVYMAPGNVKFDLWFRIYPGA